MNKIGMHIHALTSEAYQAVRRLQPLVVTIMDPSAQWIEDLRAISPRTFIVGRRYEDSQDFWRGVEPGGYAHLCHDTIAPQLADGWISANEPFGHDDHHLFEEFDSWQARFVIALRELGMEAVVNCFGTGNFTGGADRIKITDAFPRTCQAAQVYGPHDYDWPHMDRSVGWRSLRWIKWLEDLRAAGLDEAARVAVTEAGLTQATYGGPDIGWQTLDDNLMIAADLYLDSLQWYNAELVKIPECIGCATYDWAGSAFGWPTFEHLIPYLVDRIEEISAEPPENGNGENDMVKVYDFNHSPFDGPGTPYHDMAWLRSIFGDIQVHPIEEHMTLQDGQLVAKVVWLDCRVGDTAVIIHVEQDGIPQAGVVGIFGWPDAEQHGLPENWPLWTDNGAVGEPTQGNGDAGLGSYGTGAYYDPTTERGPHFVWLHSVPSDMVDGLGMLTWADGVEGNHLHVNIGYEIVAYGGEEPPPPPEPPEPGEPGEILTRLERIIADAGYVRDRLAEVDALAEAVADAL